MQEKLDQKMHGIWEELNSSPDAQPHERKYKRLELGKETGFRLSCYFPEGIWELLIEVSSDKEEVDFKFPLWQGMGFDFLSLSVPKKSSKHICLRLEEKEHKDVFVYLCADLAKDLLSVSLPREREIVLAVFFDRWSRFFEQYSPTGLSPEKQRGLMGELIWLRTLLENDIGCITALGSWKGCERGYHDFEIKGYVVEVKTTMTKEPRKVRISNERQLDEKGLLSLHLLVLTFVRSESGGESLPEVVDSISSELVSVPGGQRLFEHCLIAAGYLDLHCDFYTDTYTVKNEELFKVHEGFPRITDLPNGLGDIRYSLNVASVAGFLSEVDDYLGMVKGAM